MSKSGIERDALVMANARRLIKANKATSNARLYSELFGSGLSSAWRACVQIGLNPEGNETSYNVMMKHIENECDIV